MSMMAVAIVTIPSKTSGVMSGHPPFLRAFPKYCNIKCISNTRQSIY